MIYLMSNKKWYLNNFVVAVLLIVTAVSFSACWLKGSQGPQGPAGQDGSNLIVTYMDYLDYIWDHNVNNVKGEYSNNKDLFYVNFPKDHLTEKGPQGPAGDLTFAQASNLAVQSAVDIVANRKGSNDWSSGQVGSGVIYQLELNTGAGSDRYTGNGFIITNYHVIARYMKNGGLVVANEVYVHLYGQSNVHIPVRVIGGSPDYDIAILELKGTDNKYKSNGNEYSLTMDGTTVHTVRQVINSRVATDPANDAIRPVSLPGKTSGFYGELTLGSSIFAVGNPLGYHMSVTEGVVSVTSEIIKLPYLDESIKGDQNNRVMRISSGINPGNSGGGVFNLSGQLVGIVQARMYYADNTYNLPVDAMAYAIPLDIAARVADQIITRGKGITNADNAVLCATIDDKFAVSAINIKATYDGFKLTMSEQAKITKKGSTTFEPDTIITSITVGPVVNQSGTNVVMGTPQPITRAWLVEILLVEAYGNGKGIVITGTYNGVPVTWTKT
jgi:S1-C subfamily serine protease